MSDTREAAAPTTVSAKAPKAKSSKTTRKGSPTKTKRVPKRKRYRSLPNVRRSVPSVEGLSVFPTAIVNKDSLTKKKGRTVSWRRTAVSSSARSTPVDLKHWTKYSAGDHRFARFNKELTILKYSDSEYQALLSGDAQWSRDETDRLMDLVQRFDRRFLVVSDRFGRSKTVEQLKARYFFIQEKLSLSRAQDGESVQVIPYDAAYESNRKAQLEMLFKRTKQTELETAKLVSEKRRLDLAIRKVKKENSDTKKVLRLQRAIVKGSNSIVEGLVKRRKSRGAESFAAQAGRFAQGSLGGLPESVVVTNAFRSRPSGCYLRGTQLLAPVSVNSRLAKQLDSELETLNIYPSDFTVPSSFTCELFDRLRQDMLTMFNLQKLVLRKEAEVQAFKAEADPSSALKVKMTQPSVATKKPAGVPPFVPSTNQTKLPPVVVSLKASKRPMSDAEKAESASSAKKQKTSA